VVYGWVTSPEFTVLHWGRLMAGRDDNPFNVKLGNIIEVGIRDDVNDRAYIVLNSLDGQAIYVDVGKNENIDGLARDMIVEINPANIQPKKSDYIIAEIASKRSGTYSPSAHLSDDPSARPAYIQAHVRRLEALRRAGHAVRHSDGSWKIPIDYLKRATAYEKSRMQSTPVEIAVRLRLMSSSAAI